MDDKDVEVTQLNEDANEMLSKAPSGSLQELARSLMRMNALWTHTYQQVEHYSKLFITSDQQWREFKGENSVSSKYFCSLSRTGLSALRVTLPYLSGYKMGFLSL